MKSFEYGELFVYINGDKAEIGKVKRKNNTGDGYFCYYHEGDTAADTPLECMYKLVNNYTIKATTLGRRKEEECSLEPGTLIRMGDEVGVVIRSDYTPDCETLAMFRTGPLFTNMLDFDGEVIWDIATAKRLVGEEK